MSLTIPVQTGTVPTGFCPSNYQDIANQFAAIFSVTIPGSNAGVVIQPNKPTDQTVYWVQLDTFGRPVRPYVFAQGAWLSLHPDVPGTTIIWTGVLPDFTTFDGGDANSISAISGPMWQQALDANNNLIAAQFLLAAGTLPSGSVIATGTVGGEEKHTLTLSELAPHTHDVKLLHGNSYTGEPNQLIVGNGQSDPMNFTAPNAALSAGGDPSTGTPPATALPHNTLPPYVGVYFLQRTARLFYTVQ